MAFEGLLTVAVGPSSGSSPVQEVTQFDTVQVKLNMDTGDELSFTTSAWAPEATYLDELASDVWLSGAVAQRFRVTALDQVWDADGSVGVAVTALSYKRLLSGRLLHSDLTYTAQDQGEILWGLIAHTQAQAGGSWGVTKGTVTTGQVRDRSYFIGENIGDLAGKLQEVINGMYWTIDANLVVSAQLMSAFTQHIQPLIHGVNCTNLSRKGVAAAQFANAVYADADESTVPVWVAAAGIATDPRGRWEKAVGFPTVVLQATLAEHANGELQAAYSPRATWDVQMDPERWVTDSKYLPGMYVEVVNPPDTVAPIGAPPRSSIVQVVEVAGSLTADGALTIGLTGVETARA